MNRSVDFSSKRTNGGYALLFFLTIHIFMVVLAGCSDQDESKLPIYGKVTKDFKFRNQDNELVTLATFDDKIYVTDFFFTSCPTICPITKRQMHRVYEVFKDTPDFVLLSHTIDPEFDTVEILNNFAKGFGVKTSGWQMVTGDQDELFAMAKHYMLGAMKKEDAPGGYIHSGSFVLVDKEKQIRGYYDGTNADEVDALIADLRVMLKQKN